MRTIMATGMAPGMAVGPALALLVALAGCATTGRPDHGAAAAAAIRYETSPCFGTCPVYVVTVRPDGTGTFEGKRFTAVTGTRDFTVSAADYRRFAAVLAPYRPAAGERLYRQGTSLCRGPMVSDMPGVDVRWTGGGAEQHISYDFGCDRTDPTMRDALRHAPDALPIAVFVKPETRFPPSR